MPIENKFEVEKGEGKVYPLIPINVYPAQLLDITSKEQPTYKTKTLPKDEQIIETVLKCQFVILKGRNEKEEDEEQKDLRGRSLWDDFIPITLWEGRDGKNKLWKIIEALLGHELTQEEEMSMNSDVLNSLIGKQCRILTKHKKSGDKTYCNVADYLISETEEEPLTKEEVVEATVKEKEKVKSEEIEYPVDDTDDPIPF